MSPLQSIMKPSGMSALFRLIPPKSSKSEAKGQSRGWMFETLVQHVKNDGLNMHVWSVLSPLQSIMKPSGMWVSFKLTSPKTLNNGIDDQSRGQMFEILSNKHDFSISIILYTFKLIGEWIEKSSWTKYKKKKDYSFLMGNTN